MDAWMARGSNAAHVHLLSVTSNLDWSHLHALEDSDARLGDTLAKALLGTWTSTSLSPADTSERSSIPCPGLSPDIQDPNAPPEEHLYRAVSTSHLSTSPSSTLTPPRRQHTWDVPSRPFATLPGSCHGLVAICSTPQ